MRMIYFFLVLKYKKIYIIRSFVGDFYHLSRNRSLMLVLLLVIHPQVKLWWAAASRQALLTYGRNFHVPTILR